VFTILHLNWAKGSHLLQSNSSDYKDTFLDLDIQIHNLRSTIKIYDKRIAFDFDIVNFPCFDGDVPLSPSYRTYLSQLISVATVCNKVEDFNDRNSIISGKLLEHCFLYHKLRESFAKFYNRHFDLVKRLIIPLYIWLKGYIASTILRGLPQKNLKSKMIKLMVFPCSIRTQDFLNKTMMSTF